MSETSGSWLYEKTWETLKKRLITCAVVVAVAVGGGLGGYKIVEKAGACADGVTKSDGECIGINGSGYDWDVKEIGPVVDRIEGENRKLGKTYATVAVMLPLEPGSKAEKQQLRSELQGAYIAQYRANREEGAPKVRLVLANPGKDYEKQGEVVPDLVRMSKSTEHRLLGVTGFNLSLDSTKAAIRDLTEEKVPVLVARASAGSLDGDGKRRFDGMARILPTNEEQARALADFNGSRKNSETVIVRDTRPDPYVRSLAEAFQALEKQETGPDGPDTMTFASPDIAEEGDVDNQFRPTVDTICSSGANTVYFAGRSTHLRLFLKRLAQDKCEDTKFKVVSGSDAASLKNKMSDDDWAQLVDDSGKQKMAVQYAAPAHPAAWDTEVEHWQDDQEKRTGRRPDEAKAPGSLRDPRNELESLKQNAAKAGNIGPLDLADSRTMMVHDGVRTTIEAIRGAKLPGKAAPTPEQVGNRWSTMQAKNRVDGTSGRICLTPERAAYNKALAVVELHPGEKARSSRLGYVGLAWPLERKQEEDCVVRGS